MKLPKRFIVVDDDPTSNMICEYCLRRFSDTIEVLTFLEPQIALTFIQNSYNLRENQIPTLLFLDINMPILTGWDFLTAFADFPASVKDQFSIYILSSSIDERDMERAETNPLVKRYISKPLSTKIVNSLLAAI